ncbi:MAG TPA: redoxin domain-containing protein, partial [Bacteroidia bacterium]|nr:redoxin domain-containing protein [Bacteroidia bacterium]
MIRKAIFISFAALLLSAGSLFAQNGYEIKVKVKGVADSLCYLANYFGEKQYIKDSCNADKEGNFLFKGSEALPGGIYLVVVPGRRYFEIIVDRQQKFSIETDNADLVGALKVKGSSDNEAFYEYLKFIGVKSKEVEPLKAEYEAAKDDPVKTAAVKAKIADVDSAVFKYREKFIEDHKDSFISKVFKASDEIKVPDAPLKPDGTKDSSYVFYYYKEHFFDNIDLQDDRMLRTPVLHPKLEQYMTKMTLQMPDSVIKAADWLVGQLKPGSEMFKYVVWWITNTYETSKIMGLDAVFVHMVDNYYTREKAFWVDDAQLYKIQERARILTPLLIGTKCKNLILADSLGKMQSLYDVKAPYTVLYFWDPDCGHCQKATPKLKEVYDKYRAQGLKVYAVCTEVEMDKWKKFINEHNLDWINVADPEVRNNFRHDFDITSTPQVFLLDDSKIIRAKKVEVETLDDILKR